MSKTVLGLVVALFLGVVAGCGGAEETQVQIRSAAELKGKHVAHMSSDFHREKLLNLQRDLTFEPYTEYQFAVESLRKRKLEAISLGDTIAEIWMAKFPDEFSVAFTYAQDHCAFLFPKGLAAAAKLNAELRRMNAEGTGPKIVRKWIEAAKTGTVPELPRVKAPPKGAPVLRVAAATQIEPWCFVTGERIVGADVELLMVLAERLGYRLEFKGYSFRGMIDAVNGGRAEVGCGGIYVGGGTFPTLDVSEHVADIGMCILVRNEERRRRTTGGVGAWFKSVGESFHRTFMVENRWKMMTRGLGVTLLITFCAALLGTLLAFPVWLGRTAKNRIVSLAAKTYVSVLQGTPVLVLLMVLFYLVFGGVDLDGMWVAVIGFALNASAYIGEALRSGIASVPRGQTEAALALGYRPHQAFLRFVLPQAVRTILPVYRGELVGLLKATSIVGYIAINDLNKASDLIRSRTYESFFPILTTAFIYFAVAWLLALLLDWFGRRLDPANRRNA